MSPTTRSERLPMTSFEDHPLEVLPWARRIPPSPLRDLAYTAIFNLLLAGIFTLFAMLFTKPAQWAEIARANLVFANCIGFVIHAGFALGDWLTGRRCRTWPFWLRAVYYAGVPVAGANAVRRMWPALDQWLEGRSL